MSSLWLSIEPTSSGVRLMLTEPQVGTCLKARLPPRPHHPRALAMLLETLAAWYGRPLTAVLDADAEDVRQHPTEWAQLLGDLEGSQIAVEWVGPPRPLQRDLFLDPMRGFARASRLLRFAATGQR